MSGSGLPDGVRSLDLARGFWERVHTVAPLVVVGTKEDDGYDLAPKHLAGPLSWEGHYGFVCSARHSTYHNAKAHRGFTVSYPRPDQVVLASLAAAPREGCESDKPIVHGLPTFTGSVIDAPLLMNAYFFLECELDRIVDGFGPNSLIAGRVVAAHAHEDGLVVSDEPVGEKIRRNPLLAYIDPGRYARIEETSVFPFPDGFRR